MNAEDTNSMIVGIRFSPIGKNYYFDASNLQNLKLGDYLIVQTSRGWQLGELTKFVEAGKVDKKIKYKPVNRLANEADLKKKEYLDGKSEELLTFARKKISIKEIKNVKIVSAEFSFDEKSLTFLYSTENDSQINFNSIIKEIRSRFEINRVDFHKIGPRDVAKYYGGMGACGLENRCCSQFLEKFESISIRMAKKQGISLTPSDITGMCNRLRCCLNYEYCIYVEALKDMPRRKKKVQTPYGEGIVKDLAPITKTVFVAVPGHGVKELGLDEIEEIKPSESKNIRKNTNNQSKKGSPQRNGRPGRRKK